MACSGRGETGHQPPFPPPKREGERIALSQETPTCKPLSTCSDLVCATSFVAYQPSTRNRLRHLVIHDHRITQHILCLVRGVGRPLVLASRAKLALLPIHKQQGRLFLSFHLDTWYMDGKHRFSLEHSPLVQTSLFTAELSPMNTILALVLLLVVKWPLGSTLSM